MKCANCKFYSESREENECLEFGFYCFQPFFEKECTYINDDFSVNENGLELNEVL